MGKTKTRYVCSACGSVSPKWLGKCPDCGGWNTFAEELEAKESVNPVARGSNQKPVKLRDITGLETLRYITGIGELDLVLGGGVVKGSVVLVGGEPGIGKSTIMLQIAGVLGNSGKRLIYISGEESAEQIKMRSDRLNLESGNIDLLTTSSFEDLLIYAEGGYDFIIVDSVQTVTSAELSSAGGTVGQVRHITYRLVELAKTRGITVFIVGQVTKDGAIAGPKVLEHLVDTVLYFEGDYARGLRLLRTVKNRFGSTGEVGLFEMSENGLKEVTGDLFISRGGEDTAGQAIAPVMEGSRTFLVEIQALASPTFFPIPKRSSNGFDINRLQMIAAVLEKRGGLGFFNADIYLNVAGGLRITETSADAAVAAALASSASNIILPADTVFIGEIGLSGAIRPVSNLSMRLNEAVRLGAKRLCTPAEIKSDKLEIIKITDIKALIKLINSWRAF
ncbi:MAG: DNA repair protein RadA [Deferribacteraceae bacterium]|jgi:DNA repair protein RadA/Sms|nr:DNA repair protein RadA [Deferribacteraceae bacterium]